MEIEVRIGIVTTQVPFVTGGAEYHAFNLRDALVKAGHLAEIITMPFKWYPPERIPEHILSARLLDLEESCGNKIDLLIGLKFPAYFIPHSNKVMWILHQYRQAYELWGTEFSDLHLSSTGVAVRDAIIRADNTYFLEAKKIYANSQTVADRLQRYNHISAETLYHPCPNWDELYFKEYGDFIFFPSRVDSTKRQHLAIEAMRHTGSNLRLIIAGGSESKEYVQTLYNLIRKYHLDNKVQILGEISTQTKLELYAECRGVLFIPHEEDYGYVTLEGMRSQKPIITTTDSGGPLEFVIHEHNGLIASPEAASIAQQIDKLSDSNLATVFGINARKTLDDKGISWQNVIERLTSQ